MVNICMRGLLVRYMYAPRYVDNVHGVLWVVITHTYPCESSHKFGSCGEVRLAPSDICAQ